jgi:hypothetical protein
MVSPLFLSSKSIRRGTIVPNLISSPRVPGKRDLVLIIQTTLLSDEVAECFVLFEISRQVPVGSGRVSDNSGQVLLSQLRHG